VHLLNEKKIRNQKHVPNLGDGVSQLAGGQVVCARASSVVGQWAQRPGRAAAAQDVGSRECGAGRRIEGRIQRSTGDLARHGVGGHDRDGVRSQFASVVELGKWEVK
jgi:hypothetical protein